jgi:hypothetical protein
MSMGRITEGITVQRAAFVSKHPTRKSSRVKTPVRVGSEEDSTKGFTERMLMSMVFDISQLAEDVERVKVQFFTLAKAHGIVPPVDID